MYGSNNSSAPHLVNLTTQPVIPEWVNNQMMVPLGLTGFIGVLAFTSNLIIILAIFNGRLITKEKQTQNFFTFIVALSLTDLCIGLGNALACLRKFFYCVFPTVFAKRFIFECAFYDVLVLGGGMQQACITLEIGVDRLLSILFPFKVAAWCERPFALYMTSITAVLAYGTCVTGASFQPMPSGTDDTPASGPFLTRGIPWGFMKYYIKIMLCLVISVIVVYSAVLIALRGRKCFQMRKVEPGARHDKMEARRNLIEKRVTLTVTILLTIFVSTVGVSTITTLVVNNNLSHDESLETMVTQWEYAGWSGVFCLLSTLGNSRISLEEQRYSSRNRSVVWNKDHDIWILF